MRVSVQKTCIERKKENVCITFVKYNCIPGRKRRERDRERQRQRQAERERKREKASVCVFVHHG